MNRLALAACSLSALLVATPVLADVVVKKAENFRDKTVNQTLDVRTSDLNLADAHALRTLDNRLAAAVREVCGYAEVRQPANWADMMQCRKDARARAEADRDALLAARLAARGDPAALARLEGTPLRVGG
ncbi:UrcA family protein [Novosphingobium sp. 1949]|uniref:UrcA family protein n=1 Tax=Novosphingobium organovorum TaxID=2930092 RepID=A0ABT0BEQ4_9SPHN|nr:UrcA family protein [Novosphingobium organovorum]MCJ2183527.1 UrcA family protein [Novosphingobium organovorum]